MFALLTFLIGAIFHMSKAKKEFPCIKNNPEHFNCFPEKRKIRKSITWKKFLKFQIHLIYAMDFFTIDTIFYVYFILHHKTREIVQFAVTQNPAREFVRQQLI